MAIRKAERVGVVSIVYVSNLGGARFISGVGFCILPYYPHYDGCFEVEGLTDYYLT